MLKINNLHVKLEEEDKPILKGVDLEVPAGAVHLSITSGAGVLTCRIVDQGRPMPGLRLPEGKIGPPDCRVHELPEGGWGWALIRLLTLNLQYERLDGCNRVTFQVPVQSEARDR